MNHCTNIPIGPGPGGQRVEQVPPPDPAVTDAAAASALTPELESGYRSALWRLGVPLAAIDVAVAELHGSGLDEERLAAGLRGLVYEAELRATEAWEAGAGGVQQRPGQSWPPSPGMPGQAPIPPTAPPPVPGPPGMPQPGPHPGPGTPPAGPPYVPQPPDGSTPPPAGPPPGGPPPAVPTPPTVPDPTDPQPPSGPVPPKDPGGDDGSIAPWLVGAGLVAAGVGSVVAFRNGSRNVEALRAARAAYQSGAMHQGGMQAIRDANLGARFASGIGTSDLVAVAVPGINRVGSNGRLTAVARGHLDHAELLAAGAALRRGGGGAVSVDEPLRATVLDGLVSGRSMQSVLDDLDRTARQQTVALDNPQLQRYWDQASVVERGPRTAHVTSGASVHRPELRLTDPDGAGHRQLVETGGTTRINRIQAGRNARLGEAGLAEGLGTIQGLNVSTLNPAMQARAIGAAGVDPRLVESIGLPGAFTQRWRDRLALGAGEATPPPPPAQ